ncbi:diphosphoinositol polyphosphate phosphohydrolase 1-like [Anneissia japonica]|uniref:diphosphoinositol polyphosphate phosphohydrolase 1-like n=1 Tax=Anneissia japonica TaxID=1529436 RepID=UPI001425B65E|nr:diphosphoinositol polyphosphate phosphohydrolase 1-like [Anneissia japonica]
MARESRKKERNMKTKTNSERTYYDDGFRKRSACLCFRSPSREEVLLVSSSGSPGNWVVPGGGQEPEETPGDAAIRELKEEAGVIGCVGKHVGDFEYEEGGKKKRTSVFCLMFEKELDEWLDQTESGRRRKWFNIKDALSELKKYKPRQCMYLEKSLKSR